MPQMIEPNSFQNLEDHEKITKLEGIELNNFKAVAFLHLGNYEEALKFVQKNSYESAYAHYKLRNYKKALKIANKNEGEKWDVLKSQIFYGLGYFNKAFELLNKLPKDDEIVVNLQAMKSMGILTDKVNKVVGHKLFIKQKEEEVFYDNLENYKFSDDQIYSEFLFNKTFECADKKSEFIDTLKKLTDQFPKMGNFKMQLANIEGYFDEIDSDELTKTQKNILNFNMKKVDNIENGMHFLSNFQKNLSDNQFKWIENAKQNNFKINWNQIPDTSENLNVLRILVGLINKNIKDENIKRILGNIKNEIVKEKVEELLKFTDKK